jgi:thioredoxin reductase
MRPRDLKEYDVVVVGVEPGFRERWGRDLLHCPYCHGDEVRDQPLGVLGARRRPSSTHC